MSKNNLKYFVCIDIFTEVVIRDLGDDTLVAISCIKMVCQYELTGDVAVWVKIIMIDNKYLAGCL